MNHSEENFVPLLYMKMGLLNCDRTNTFNLLLIEKVYRISCPIRSTFSPEKCD